MATGFEHFDRDLQLALVDMEPEAMRRELAAFARSSLAEVISSGQAPAEYERFVNDRAGVPEEAVELPGPIVYLFTNWKLVIETALAELSKRVPRRTGRYAGSFIVTVNGAQITGFDRIPAHAEVVIFNAQPYTRKLETQGAGYRVAKHFTPVRGIINRRFSGAFASEVKFLSVSGGVDPRVPYILKRSAGRRKDRQAGMPITYPALILNAI